MTRLAAGLATAHHSRRRGVVRPLSRIGTVLGQQPNKARYECRSIGQVDRGDGGPEGAAIRRVHAQTFPRSSPAARRKAGDRPAAAGANPDRVGAHGGRNASHGRGRGRKLKAVAPASTAKILSSFSEICLSRTAGSTPSGFHAGSAVAQPV